MAANMTLLIGKTATFRRHTTINESVLTVGNSIFRLNLPSWNGTFNVSEIAATLEYLLEQTEWIWLHNCVAL